MSSHVHNQIGRVGESTTTVHAQMALLVYQLLYRILLMDLHVRTQIILPIEFLTALGTFEFLFRRDVDLDVPLQVFESLEALAAHLTNELLLLVVRIGRTAEIGSVPERFGGFVFALRVLIQAGLPHEFLVTEGAEELFLMIFALLFQMSH